MKMEKNQPAYMRQRYLLDFIRQLDSGAFATDIQKLVFLDSQTNSSAYYEFIPYKYGPYSFQLAEDIDTLCEKQFIVCDHSKYRSKEPLQLSLLCIPSERGDMLIRKVYEEYPYYAINSEIIKRLFPTSERIRFVNEKNNLKKQGIELFTIGYEGRSLEAFINTLIQNDIRLLCDVRRNPLSRKFGFSKGKLQHILGTIGIEYVHIPEVGIDSSKRTTLKSFEDYELLFSDYEANIPMIKGDLDRIASLLYYHKRIALMCYEKEPRFCHRHIIRDYIVQNYEVNCEDL